jgi:hypothetical protein
MEAVARTDNLEAEQIPNNSEMAKSRLVHVSQSVFRSMSIAKRADLCKQNDVALLWDGHLREGVFNIEPHDENTERDRLEEILGQELSVELDLFRE